MIEVVNKSISSNDSFTVECKKCGSTDVSLLYDKAFFHYNSNDTILKCNLCEFERTIMYN